MSRKARKVDELCHEWGRRVNGSAMACGWCAHSVIRALFIIGCRDLLSENSIQLGPMVGWIVPPVTLVGARICPGAEAPGYFLTPLRGMLVDLHIR